MKKYIKFIIFSLLIFNYQFLFSQIASGLNYQAVIRNNAGELLKNHVVKARFTILDDESTVIFTESNAFNTNEYGLINIVIGKDNTVFENINWSNGPYDLKVEIDTGSGFEDMGTTKIYAVPYANLAKDVINNDDADADPANELQTLSISGNNLTISDGNTISIPNNATSLWVKNGNNVYRNSGNVGIGTSAPASRLAVGGTGTDKIAIYGVTGEKTGTGVAGYSTSSSGINFGGRFSSSGSSGRGVYGHAVSTSGKNYGGYFTADGESGRGVYAFASSTTGTNYGGKFESKGQFGAGVSAKATGNHASAVYGEATSLTGPTNGGNFKTSSSAGIGVQGIAYALKGENYGGAFRAEGDKGIGVYGEASSRSDSIKYGGYFQAKGKNGIGIYAVSKNNSSESSPNSYGGYFKAEGKNAIGIISKAPSGIGVSGYGISGGFFSGRYSGISSYSGGHDLRLNYDAVAGTFNSSSYGGSGKCYGIKSWGDHIGVYGSGHDYDFYAAGPGTNYGSSSSKRWKKNIVEIPDPIKKIKRLRGVYFDWDAAHGGQHDVGCIAEEVGKVLPEIVVYEENGIDADGMDYSKLTPLLIEAIKAQQKLIEDLTKRIEELEK